MKTTMGLLGVLLSLSAFEANAAPSYPRDLVCKTQGGAEVTLKSNNSFLAQVPAANYAVELLLDRGAGVEVFENVFANLDAQKTRGNDTGNKRYIFSSANGEKVFVELEFTAPHGLATGIAKLQILSESLQVEHSQQGLQGACRLVYHPAIDL